MAISALFFDVGNTLLFPNRQKMLRPLHQRGVFPAEEVLTRIERETKHEFDDLLEGHRAVDRGFWQIFYSRLLKELNIEDEALAANLVASTRMSANWCDIRPGTREVLLHLGQSYRMGVISNADGKIAEVLARCGIVDCFESITDSGVVGREKPDPAIFRAAVERLGVSAKESLYVGDVYSVDYLGATGAGMRAVLFDVVGAYRDRGLPRAESLEELSVALEEVGAAQN